MKTGWIPGRRLAAGLLAACASLMPGMAAGDASMPVVAPHEPSAIACIGRMKGMDLDALAPPPTPEDKGVRLSPTGNDAACDIDRKQIRILRETGTPPADRAVVQRWLDSWARAMSSVEPHMSPSGRLLREASFDGRWKGTMAFTGKGAGLPDRVLQDVDVEMAFDHEQLTYTATVRDSDGPHTTVMEPSDFHMVGRGPSRIAWMEHTGGENDDDTIWVETWSLSMTLVDPDHLMVYLSRQVNNVDLDKPDAKWGRFGTALLARVR